MKMMRSTVALGLLIGLGACSNMMGGSGSAPRATAAATQPTVAPDMVRQVQLKLRDDGYYKLDNIDGVWGSGTEAAVRSFQRDHNLIGSGQLDVPTLQAMNLPGGTQANTHSGPSDRPAATDSTITQPMRTDPYSAPGNNTVVPPPR